MGFTDKQVNLKSFFILQHIDEVTNEKMYFTRACNSLCIILYDTMLSG